MGMRKRWRSGKENEEGYASKAMRPKPFYHSPEEREARQNQTSSKEGKKIGARTHDEWLCATRDRYGGHVRDSSKRTDNPESKVHAGEPIRRPSRAAATPVPFLGRGGRSDEEEPKAKFLEMRDHLERPREGKDKVEWQDCGLVVVGP